MCGIYSCFHNGKSTLHDRHKCIQTRGPDQTKIVKSGNYDMVFYRLKVVGRDTGTQPFNQVGLTFMCNGEIYNYKELEQENKIQTDTDSDCDVIGPLYKLHGAIEMTRMLRGEFAYVIYDHANKLVHFARDYIGRKGLYYGVDYDDKGKIKSLEVCSLANAVKEGVKVFHVLPRYVYTYDMGNNIISKQQYMSLSSVPKTSGRWEKIYTLLEEATRDRITQSEIPIGFLLSGGLDSSVLLSLALQMKLVKKPRVFTFGFDKDAPDVKAAHIVVNDLRKRYGQDCIDWHLVIQPIRNGLNVIRNVVQALETYDTTTIRAATPMYLISKYIAKKTDVRVIISGEGADELFGGYLYNMYAPNEYAFKADVIQSLENLYLYDCLRADRVTAVWGLEVRCPFLDERLVTHVLGSSRLLKPKHTTKELLRDVIKTRNLLPNEIIWGKKEAFSDAVSLSWQDTIESYAKQDFPTSELVYDELKKEDITCHLKPKSYADKWFQTLFLQLFPKQDHLLPKYWVPNQQWVDTNGESSARALPIYKTVLKK
jgi:asparagine synthase (glutamine-hydrolysing)